MASILKTTNDATAILTNAIVKGLRKGAQIVRNYAVMNVTGRVLNRDTGRLATSIATRVMPIGGGGALDVGTQVKYGAYWEEGFVRWGRMNRRPWLKPAVRQALPQVTRLVENEVEKAIKDTFNRTVTINIKVA